jgi:hypothetical protein
MVLEIRQGENGRRKLSRTDREWCEKPIRAQMVRVNYPNGQETVSGYHKQEDGMGRP